MRHTHKTWLTDILLLCLFIGGLFTFMLGSRPLNVPDEGRYSEIPREMLVSHDFVTPHINGIKYFEKPPLFYWLQSTSIKTFGLSEWSARGMNALLGLLGCLGTYFAARKLYGRKTGLLAAITLSTSLLYFVLARVITLDMSVSVFISFALFSFILRYYYWVYIFAGLAVLSKGLIGIIFPGSIIFLWLLFTGNWSILRKCKLISGTLIFLAITLPWHILVQLKNPEFFNYYFITQQFSRYLTMSAGRYEPLWYFIPIFLVGLFPWTGFLWGAKQVFDKKNPNDLFLLISIIFIFIFYSISHSKLVPYILPCFPFMAILLAKYFASDIKTKFSLWLGFGTASLLSLGFIIAAYTQLTPEVAINYTQALFLVKIIYIILILNIILIPLILKLKNFLWAYISQIILFILYLFSICALAPHIYMDSMKPLVLKLKPYLKSNDLIGTYHFYYQDLPYYLNQTVSIISWKGELEFGEDYLPKANNYLLDDKTLWQRWNSKQHIYLFVPDQFYKEINHLPYRYYIIAEDKKDMLITNHPEKARS